MDAHPDPTYNLPAHDSVHVHNLLDDSETGLLASPFDTGGLTQNCDPQIIPGDPNQPTARSRGSKTELHGDTKKSEQTHSSVVYPGHNVFQRHNTFDFIHYSANTKPHQLGTSPSPARDKRFDATAKAHLTDPPIRSTMDSDIVRWATAIPDKFPLNLSGLAATWPGIDDRVPQPVDYPLIALLAIFGSPGGRLTDVGMAETLVKCFRWFRKHSGVDHWKLAVIKCMLIDKRFKSGFGSNRFWTINMSELARRPFVDREAWNRPRHALAPGLSFCIENPSSGTTSRDTLRSARRDFLSIDPTYHTIPPVYVPGKNSGTSVTLPSYSKGLPAEEACQASEGHVPADSGVVDDMVLPSIREVLGYEMHLVKDKVRSNRS